MQQHVQSDPHRPGPSVLVGRWSDGVAHAGTGGSSEPVVRRKRRARWKHWTQPSTCHFGRRWPAHRFPRRRPYSSRAYVEHTRLWKGLELRPIAKLNDALTRSLRQNLCHRSAGDFVAPLSNSLDPTWPIREGLRPSTPCCLRDLPQPPIAAVRASLRMPSSLWRSVQRRTPCQVPPRYRSFSAPWIGSPLLNISGVRRPSQEPFARQALSLLPMIRPVLRSR
ncbi:hypothetical protein FEP87_05912 [Burkholderia multivorans]|nr:hypothetical protein [Burkholderia multivorans]